MKLDNCFMSGTIHIFTDGVPLEAEQKYARPIFPDEPDAEKKKAAREAAIAASSRSDFSDTDIKSPVYQSRYGLCREGREIGSVKFSPDCRVISADVEGLSGKHAIYFLIEGNYKGWGAHYMDGRNLFDFFGFVFQV